MQDRDVVYGSLTHMQTFTTEPTGTRSAFNAMLPYAAWSIALLGMAGSLFFSEVMELPPCVLCWYQRIAMYPLIVIIGIGILRRNSEWRIYAIVLTLIGLLISIYHNLLYYGFIPESITPCTEGVPCNAIQLELLGFVTIPLMGLISFIVLTFCLMAYRPKEN